MNLNDRDTEYASFDDTFSHVVERANTVVFAATVLTPSGTPLAGETRLTSLPWQYTPGAALRLGNLAARYVCRRLAVGVNNLESEAGLRLRRLPLVFMLDGKMIPSLVLQAAAQFLGADLASSEVQIGRAVLLRRKDGKLLRTVPIDDEGRMRIRYHQGPIASWQASFDNIMLYDDQIQNGITPEYDLRSLVRGRSGIGAPIPASGNALKPPWASSSRVEVQLQAERTIAGPGLCPATSRR